MGLKLIPNMITAAALMVSFAAIVAASHHAYLLSAQLMMLVLILDGLDGFTARMLRCTSAFGAELDTFVDHTAFGLVPAYLIFQILVPEQPFWGWTLALATVMSGASRLARFRVVDPYRGQMGYLGLPITVNAGWVAMMVLITESGILGSYDVSLGNGIWALLAWGCSAIFLVLQVSYVRYGKPTKTPYVFVGGVVCVALLFFRVEVQVGSALMLIAFGLYYAFISPIVAPPKPPPPSSVDEDDEDEDDLDTEIDSDDDLIRVGD
ncbi:MAG TPA: CDP-alcohol phosphatidyltransferase family protein [Kiritimatiellia bacterium]|nr:CDP-alcohol phosphatidyltransferase family protein [Kiritimatiellia bacterium]